MPQRQRDHTTRESGMLKYDTFLRNAFTQNPCRRLPRAPPEEPLRDAKKQAIPHPSRPFCKTPPSKDVCTASGSNDVMCGEDPRERRLKRLRRYKYKQADRPESPQTTHASGNKTSRREGRFACVQKLPSKSLPSISLSSGRNLQTVCPFPLMIQS